MKKLTLAFGVAMAMSTALISPAPAAASCTTVIDGGGCIETTICRAANFVLDQTSLGRELSCIQ